MERKNITNNINRNTSNRYNHIVKNRVGRNNLVTPEVFVSEIWMQGDTNINGVEIIELNSSNSEREETIRESANNFSQAWSFVNTDRFKEAEEDYRINNIARERRRKKNDEEHAVEYTNEYLHHDTQTNFNGFHYINDSEISGIPHNQQMNCFTIINNHVINSDSSSDNDCTRVEEIESYTADNNIWDHVYNEDIVKYDPVNTEKRTVWIYSFKNKRRLSENDFELINIPSTDTSASPISDEENKTDKDISVFRIASPIPAPFIPRLDLSLAQTLSTVTEVSVDNSRNSSPETLVKKPVNNWLTERYVQFFSKKIPNVINWLGLSPRERRRRFKNTNSDGDQTHNRKEYTYAEGNTHEGKPEVTSRKTSSALIQVDVEVHASDVPTPTTLEDVEIVSIESFEMKPNVQKKNVDHTLSINISYADADIEIDNENKNYNLDPSSKPSIKLTSNNTYDKITEPLEKLDSTKWIFGEEAIEEQTAVFDYVFDDTENDGDDHTKNEIVDETENDRNFRNIDVCDSASKRLWLKSTKLMKSPLWAEYLPITETLPSLHLSLSLSSIQDKKSWFKRIGKYFKCCK